MNRFINYPVGQGFFYAGKIRDYNIVYDCGTKNNVAFINRFIEIYKKEFNCSGKIDMLIISHFHKDHISGLKELIGGKKPNFKVGKLVIPYYNPDYLLLLKLLLISFEINENNIEEIYLVPVYRDENDTNDSDSNFPFSENEMYNYNFPYENGVMSGINLNLPESKISKKYKDYVQDYWLFNFFNLPGKNEKEFNSLKELKENIDDL
ncbi:TPA: MBL fold metallo-hydrolase, partial [Listeria innocua]|nr:MBL fold metallo-hydrolase [Listeria innocua]